MTEFTDDRRSDANTAINAKLWAACQAEAKRKFKIHPSAFSNGYASKIYKERGGKWRSDSLKEWFAEDWKAINSSGKIVGGCGDGETKGKVKCLPASKARSLSKKDRSTLAKRKQKQDPSPNREGAPVMVSSKKREDAMTPEVFARTIVSIEQKYGLRLDARSVWLRMDDWKRLGPNQMGKPCGRGWVGLRGACKRGKKSDDNTAKIKESKVALADKIRKNKGLRDRNAPKVVVEEKIVKKTRAEVLQASLEKKQQKLAGKLDQHWTDVRSANGQPLNDKRNGQSTMNRWEKQNNAIGSHIKDIEKTENAIDRENGLMRGVQEANKDMPTSISKMVESGDLTQWRKYPNRFFVPGVDKARIVWDPKKQELAHSHTGEVTDKEQWKKFAATYNQLKKDLEAQPKNPKADPPPNTATKEAKTEAKSKPDRTEWSSSGEVKGLRIGNSQHMAIPVSGRKNSRLWEVVNLSNPKKAIYSKDRGYHYDLAGAKEYLEQQASDEDESRKGQKP